jgi:predicted RNA binding protein YcfA (HicA-like mRNA interferase family)
MPMSGQDMLKRYLKAGWVALRQRGSHVQVEKGALNETIPIHKELRKGTEQKLLKSLRKSEEK